MALRRCPYCKAIIDESSEYCSNCGTQLLFPEDEFIEEEIPGEKIVDDEPEEESEEEEVEENSGQKRRKRAKKAPTPEEEEESEFVEEKNSDDEEPSVEEALEKGKLEPPHMAPTDTDEYDRIEPTDRISEEEEEKEKEEESKELPAEQEREEIKEAEAEAEEKSQKELTFKTEELEKAIDTTEMEKKEIERFLNSIKKDREERKAEEGRPEIDEELPPWAARMKETPPEGTPSLEEESPEEVIEGEELDSFSEQMPPEGDTPSFDSGIGIPEEEPQKSIPFDEVTREEKKRMRLKPSSGMALWLKSRAFDILFTGVFWLIAIWMASRVMGVSLFQLISAASLTVIIFYGVLLVCYYFLFLLFLGETLGDHLFSE
jgi:hypothetical protein